MRSLRKLTCQIIVFCSVILVLFSTTGCQTTTQLTPTEVRKIFIGTPWHGSDGAFLFREDGTYTYKDFDQATPRGTWSYQMKADGTLSGSSTDYTFYRLQDGSYQYHHSRSNEYYPARPNKPPFL